MERVLIFIITILVLSMVISQCYGEVIIDMAIIATIESNNNPRAYNKRTQATGMYQITPICLKDYNLMHKRRFTLEQMYISEYCFIVANWYMNERIPQLLKHYGFSDTIDNRLIAYNYGIGNMRDKNHLPLPEETRSYIIKYNNIAGLANASENSL